MSHNHVSSDANVSPAEPWETDQMLTKSAAVELLQMIQNVKHYLASPCCT